MGALGAATASLALAAPAYAGSASVNNLSGVLSYQAAAGENNQLSVDQVNGALNTLYRVRDFGITNLSLSQLGGPSGCVIVSAPGFKCPTVGLAKMVVSLGDGADELDVSNISLPVQVTAGAGAKTIDTGGGVDEINVRNGSADDVNCGGGLDSVVGDPQDQVSGNCERVDLGPASVGTSTGSSKGGDTATGGGGGADTSGQRGHGGDASTATVFTTPLGLTMPAAALAVPRPNMAIVPLGCSASAVDGCQGEVEILLPVSSAHSAARGKQVVAARGHYVAQQRTRSQRVGRRSFKLAAGSSVKLPVKVLFRGHYALASKRRRTRALLRVTERDSSGKVKSVQTRTVLLKRTNKWSRIPRKVR